MAAQLLRIRGHELRRGAGGGRADVRDEVGDRDVGLVADRADHGDWTGGDRPREALVIEAPQILEGTAAAREDEHIHAVLDERERVPQARGRLAALHKAW